MVLIAVMLAFAKSVTFASADGGINTQHRRSGAREKEKEICNFRMKLYDKGIILMIFDFAVVFSDLADL